MNGIIYTVKGMDYYQLGTPWDSRLAIIKRLEDIGIVTYVLIDGITEVKIVHASKTLYVAELDDISKLYAACCYADADYRIQPA